jgi:hypothetical protein
MSEAGVTAYLIGLLVAWFVGLKFGAAAKFIKDMGSSG